MNRWPRTSVVGVALLFVAVLIGVEVLSVDLFGTKGPLYINAAWIVFVVVTVALADIRDRKGPS